MSEYLKPHIIILFLAVTGFGVLAVIPFSWLGNAETTRIVFDILHFPAFWCFQLLTLYIIFSTPFITSFKLSGHPISPSLIIAITTLCITGSTVLLEIIQPYIGRSRDPADLFLGILGIFAATLHFINNRESANTSTVRILLTIIYSIVFITCLYKLVMFYNKQTAVQKGFNFEQILSTRHWQNTGETPTPKLDRYADTNENHVMRGQKLDYPWTGSSFQNQKTFDISGSHELNIRFFNPGKEITLEVRLDDENGETIFPNSSKVKTGWNELTFALKSKRFAAFNKHKVVKLSFYYSTKDGPNYYYLDDIHFFSKKNKQ